MYHLLKDPMHPLVIGAFKKIFWICLDVTPGNDHSPSWFGYWVQKNIEGCRGHWVFGNFEVRFLKIVTNNFQFFTHSKKTLTRRTLSFTIVPNLTVSENPMHLLFKQQFALGKNQQNQKILKCWGRTIFQVILVCVTLVCIELKDYMHNFHK